MFKKVIIFNHKIVSSKPKTVLLVGVILAIIAMLLASTLSIELSWAALAPSGNEAVQEYQQIIEDFPSLSNILVLVEGDNYNELEQVAREIKAEMLTFDDYVTSVTVGTDQDFALRYGMAYMSDSEATQVGYAFVDPNIDTFYTIINESLKEATNMLEKGDLTDEEAAMLRSNLRGLAGIIDTTNQGFEGQVDEVALNKYLTQFFVGDSLVTSPDGKMAIITIQPSFDMMDVAKLGPAVNGIEEKLKVIDNQYDGVTIGLTGMHVVARDETASVTNDSQFTTILSIGLILLLLYIAFRSFLAPIFTFIPLVFGVIYELGIIGFTVGRLNMLTAFSAAMLIGLGIDFAIHLYSAYTEKRASGYEKIEALYESMIGTGPSILVGAFTTASAFFALNFSQLEMLRELGTVMGIGILTTLVAVFWILPSMIMLKKEKEKAIKKIKGTYPFIGKIAVSIRKYRIIIASVLLISTVFMGYQASKVTFDLNLMHLEPKGLESIRLMNYMVDKYDMSTDSFSVEVTSLDEVYRLQKQFEKVDGVSEVTSIANILPENINNNAETITKIKTLLENQYEVRMPDTDRMISSLGEIESTLPNVESLWLEGNYKGVEAQDFTAIINGIKQLKDTLESSSEANNNQIGQSFYNTYKNIGDDMLTGAQLSLETIPDQYRKQFISDDGMHYMISIFPDFDIWENLKSDKGRQFIEDLKTIDPSITGTPLFMQVIYDAAADEALIIGLVVMLILLIIIGIYFKSIKTIILAFLPLVFTLIFTVGTMVLIGMQFNMLNFLGLLLIIGIGVDDGVHILHHYQEEDGQIYHVFSNVGRAILLTTITTMCGFGSLIFSSYTGIATLGVVLFIGVAYAFIMTVVIIPIFLKDKVVENKRK